GLCEGPIHHLQ
nr:immunoglobulin heavy chain junction region [Homo sapiens]